MKTLTSIVRTWSTVAVLTVSLVAGAGGEARAAGSFLSSPEPARGDAIQTSRGPSLHNRQHRFDADDDASG